MGLEGSIQNAISSGFKAFDDIRKSCTYHSLGTVDYDSASDANVESDGIDYSNTYIIFTSYKLDDVDEDIIHSEDKKALIPQVDVSFTPKETDYLIDHNSIQWEVKSVKIDPANAMWILQIRKHNA